MLILPSHTQIDPVVLKKVGERILVGLSQDNVLILQNTHELQSLITAAAKEAKSFWSQSQVIKNYLRQGAERNKGTEHKEGKEKEKGLI
jgi:hypothetical protein